MAPSRIEGTVLGQGGEPVPGARVALAEPLRRVAGARAREAITGVDGRFAIARPARDAVLLLVRAGGYVPEVVAVPRNERRIEVALAPAGAISGTLRDARGLPLAGAQVRAVSCEAMDLGEALADGAGHFAIASLRPGRYAVAAQRGDVNLPPAWVEVGPGRAAEVALRAGGAPRLALC